jgi:hypothetical protein
LDVCSESLEIPPLVAACTDWSCARDDVAADLCSGKMPAEMLKFMMGVTSAELLEAKPNDCS